MDKSSNLATLPSVIKKGINERLKELHTAMPGIVETFDPVAQTASIQPAIKRVFKTNDGEKEILTPTELPILINVPVIFPRGGGFSLTFPVKKGDECLLTFCERSIDNWHQFGTIKIPGAKRFHALSDATAFVGLSSLPNKVPNYDNVNVQLKKDDDSVFLTLKANGDLVGHADGNIDLNCDGNAVINAAGDVDIDAGGKATIDAVTTCDITAPAINLNGIVNISGAANLNGGAAITGTVTANGKDISDGHGHAQANDSGGDTQVNISGVL